MGVAWPAALPGLVALAIPLFIHLLARGEFQRVTVATTRFMIERPRLRWRRLHISHPLLLALRMALITLCVLLIAQPFRELADSVNPDGGWTLVSTQLDSAQAQAFIDDRNAAPRWLAPGFPSLEQPRPEWQAGQLWSLLDAADQQAPGGLPFDVIVPTTIGPPGAQRPELTRAIRWINAGLVTTPASVAAPLTIDIVYDPNQQQEADAIVTAVAAWQDAGLTASARRIPVGSADITAPFVVWLNSNPFPADEQISRVVVAHRPLLDGVTVTTAFSSDGAVAVREQHAGGIDVRILDTFFETDGSPGLGLARDLLNALLGPQLAAPPDEYPVAMAEYGSVFGHTAQTDTPPRQPLASLFVWLIAVVAVLERVASAFIMRASRVA